METYYSNTTTIAAACVSAPVVCWHNLELLRASGIGEGAWFNDTSFYSLEIWKPSSGAWQSVAVVSEPGQGALLEVDYEPGIKARWLAVHGGGVAYSDEVFIDSFCCFGIFPPATPGAPALAKDCTGPKVTVTSPSFATTESYETESIEVRRRVSGGEWATVHTFSSATSWDDTDVAAATVYEYQARACNAAGCSAWSASASISLLSSTAIAIVSPATGNLSGKKRIRCSASGAITNPRLFWNGVQIGVPVLKDGFYVLDWLTYDSSQGEGVLRFQATGSDGCDARAEVEYTLSNPAAALVQAVDVIAREGGASSGMRIKSSSFRFQAEPMPASPRLRYFLRAAAYLDDQASTDTFPLEFDEDTWVQGQPLLLDEGRRSADGTTQYTWFDLLAKKGTTVGKRAIFRIRWDVGEVLTGASTFGDGSGSRIVKFQPVGDPDAVEDGDYRVLFLARKDDGSGARIYQFDGEAVELLYDLGDFNAPGAFDFALLGDKLFIASANDLFYIDTDSGEASANLTPRRESRSIAFVENVGGTLYAIFNGSDDCKCYRWNGSWKEAWALPVRIDRAYAASLMGNGYLMLAADAKLYTTTGTATPILAKTFTADITSLHERFVGLADGKLLEFVEDDWALRADRNGAINAVAVFSGVTNEIDSPRGVAGEGSDTLLEATVNPAAWADNRTLEAPPLMDETVTGVTALHRFLKQTAEAVGDPNMPGYIPAKFQEVLLIGTAPDGMLLMLEVNAVAQSPLAVEATKISAIHALPVHETIPVIEEEE